MPLNYIKIQRHSGKKASISWFLKHTFLSQVHFWHAADRMASDMLDTSHVIVTTEGRFVESRVPSGFLRAP